MRTVLIGGIGNVLLGDDGVGPFVVNGLESQFDFQENVELADLGTPGLDLPLYLSGATAVILIDSARFDGEPGSFRRFQKQDLLRIPLHTRIDPHSPALRESISLVELMGTMPRELLLIGVQGRCFDPGATLSTAVRQSVPQVVDAVRRELYELDVSCEPKANAGNPGIWWDPIFRQREEQQCARYKSD